MESPSPKFRVYLVEDSSVVVRLLTERMEDAGATVIGHSDSARSAIAHIRTLRPDAVIVDIALGSGSGFEVLRALGQLDDPRPVRVVLTNYTFAPYRDAARRLGTEHFLDKTRDIPALLELIRALTRDPERRGGVQQ